MSKLSKTINQFQTIMKKQPPQLFQMCRDPECTCGEHYNNIRERVKKPELSWKTSYQHNYSERKDKKLIGNRSTLNKTTAINPPASCDTLQKSTTISNGTQYRTSYKIENHRTTTEPKEYHISRRKTTNPQLTPNRINNSTKIPFPTLTTYGTEFIGHRGANQYVKTVPKSKNDHILKLNGKSSYSRDYMKPEPRTCVTEQKHAWLPQNQLDHKIHQKTWISAYQHQFQQLYEPSQRPKHNPELRKERYKQEGFLPSPEKVICSNPNSSAKIHVLTTGYQDEFYAKKAPLVCAKNKMKFLKALHSLGISRRQ